MRCNNYCTACYLLFHCHGEDVDECIHGRCFEPEESLWDSDEQENEDNAPAEES